MLEWQVSSPCLTPLREDLINCKCHHSRFSGAGSERCPRRAQWLKVESFPLLLPDVLPLAYISVNLACCLELFSKGILLGNVSFNIFKIQGHQIMWSVVPPWTILHPCLQGEAEMDWYWAPRIANSCHPTSFSCAECRGTLWVARISLQSTPYSAVSTWASSAGQTLETPHWTHCHSAFCSAWEGHLRFFLSLSFFSSFFLSSLSVSLGRVLEFRVILLSKTRERNSSVTRNECNGQWFMQMLYSQWWCSSHLYFPQPISVTAHKIACKITWQLGDWSGYCPELS